MGRLVEDDGYSVVWRRRSFNVFDPQGTRVSTYVEDYVPQLAAPSI